jgi:hypothetical protein
MIAEILSRLLFCLFVFVLLNHVWFGIVKPTLKNHDQEH